MNGKLKDVIIAVVIYLFVIGILNGIGLVIQSLFKSYNTVYSSCIIGVFISGYLFCKLADINKRYYDIYHKILLNIEMQQEDIKTIKKYLNTLLEEDMDVTERKELRKYVDEMMKKEGH